MSENVAEGMASTTKEWVFVARSVARLSDGQSQALRCMARAGLLAESDGDWLALAVAWHEEFSEQHMAKQCLAKAESLADELGYSDFWEDIGDAWVDVGCSKRAVTFYKRAIEHDPPRLVDDIDDPPWGYGKTSIDRARETAIEYAEEAKEKVAHDLKDALWSMALAEYVAEDSAAWIRIARSWKDDFYDTENGVRCMGQAECAADDYNDRLLLARTWKVTFENSENAVSSLESAGYGVIDTYEFHEIMAWWKRDFGVTDGFYRCLDEAHEHLEDIDAYAEFEDRYLDDLAVREVAGIESLDKLEGNSFRRLGTWQGNYLSVHRPSRFARFYSFTLAREEAVSIHLDSRVNHSLYLMSGGPDGDLLDTDDGGLGAQDEGHEVASSRLARNLAAGTYTLEVVAGQEDETSIFVLSIHRRRDV